MVGGRFARQLAPARLRRPARAQRIAGMNRHVHHAAALHALLRPERSLRIHVARVVAVVSRVRVDEAADRAVLVGDLGLDAAPSAAVARQDDLALDVDVHLLQPLVVGRHAVVHVDDVARRVAVGRIGVEDRRRISIGRVGIFRHDRLFDGHDCTRRRDHLDARARLATA